jgi:hypothetical protein
MSHGIRYPSAEFAAFRIEAEFVECEAEPPVISFHPRSSPTDDYQTVAHFEIQKNMR